MLVVRWPGKVVASRVTMAPATADPESSVTVPCVVTLPGVTLDGLARALPDWGDANPGMKTSQSAGTRAGRIGRKLERRTAAAVRVNQTTNLDVAKCSLRRSPNQDDSYLHQAGNPLLLLLHVRKVFFVLQAVIIDQFAVENERLFEGHCPWSGIRLGVVHRNFDFQGSEIRAANLFR